MKIEKTYTALRQRAQALRGGKSSAGCEKYEGLHGRRFVQVYLAIWWCSGVVMHARGQLRMLSEECYQPTQVKLKGWPTQEF